MASNPRERWSTAKEFADRLLEANNENAHRQQSNVEANSPLKQESDSASANSPKAAAASRTWDIERVLSCVILGVIIGVVAWDRCLVWHYIPVVAKKGAVDFVNGIKPGFLVETLTNFEEEMAKIPDKVVDDMIRYRFITFLRAYLLAAIIGALLGWKFSWLIGARPRLSQLPSFLN